MKQFKSLIIVLLLTLAFAFSASANETYHGTNSGGKHQRGTQSITPSGKHSSSHHSGTHHNSHQPQ
jgi:hypothetical protein